MSKTSRLVLTVAACLTVFVSAAGFAFWMRMKPDAQGRVVPFFENIDMTAHAPFAKAVAGKVSLNFYDGLPHPGWEKEIFDVEIKSQATLKSRGHYFYSSAITLSPADAAHVHALAVEVSSFSEWGGMKTCGGYHPDWLIRWTTADGQGHEMHLCFGCREAKFYGPGYQLYSDISPKAFESFKKVLTPYGSQSR